MESESLPFCICLVAFWFRCGVIVILYLSNDICVRCGIVAILEAIRRNFVERHCNVKDTLVNILVTVIGYHPWI